MRNLLLATAICLMVGSTAAPATRWKKILLLGAPLTALAATGCAAGGHYLANPHYDLRVACNHLDFITYSSDDSPQTQKEVRDYNKLRATVCWEWLTKEERENYALSP